MTQSSSLAAIAKLWDTLPSRSPAGLYLPRGQGRDVAGLLVRCEHFTPQGSQLTLVKGVLGEAASSVTYGAPAAGKSFLALDLAFAVATGMSWMNRPTKSGPVIYCVGEGASGLRYRRTAAMQARGLATASLAFLPMPLSIPDEPGTLTLLLAEAERMYGRPPVLVILDTLNRFFGAGDENTARDMTRFVAAIDRSRIRFPTVHFMFVHHAGKDESKGMRGSSVLKGAMDTVIYCEKGTDGHVAVIEKQKDGEEGLRFPFALRQVELGLGEDGNPITSCVVEPVSSTGPKAGPQLSGYSATAATVLRDLARADAAMLVSEINYELYRQRFIDAHDGNNDQTIRKAAMRAAENLQKMGAIAFAGATKPIVLKPRFWNLQLAT